MVFNFDVQGLGYILVKRENTLICKYVNNLTVNCNLYTLNILLKTLLDNINFLI